MKVKAANGLARILKAEGVPWVSCFPTNHVNNALGEEGVPILMMGPGIPAGQFDQAVGPEDIAPTLARIVGAALPPAVDGRVLFDRGTPENRVHP